MKIIQPQLFTEYKRCMGKKELAAACGVSLVTFNRWLHAICLNPKYEFISIKEYKKIRVFNPILTKFIIEHFGL